MVDSQTGAPVARAEVFQVAWRTRLKDLEDEILAVRWTTTNADGYFQFDSGLPFIGGRVGSRARISFEIYHPDYGVLQPKARSDDESTLRLELIRRYTDTDRLRRSIWEKGLSCPPSMPTEYCLHLCRTLIARDRICRHPETIETHKSSMPKDFEPPSIRP